MNAKANNAETSHGHGLHGHDHHAHGSVKGSKLAITIALNILITVGQVGGGLISGSLALVSDALHNFSDVMALVISYIAEKLSSQKFSPSKTFGYRRAEIIAAMINSASLLFVGGYLVFVAIVRLVHPEPIQSVWVMSLALLSIAANGACVFLLKTEAEGSLNIKSAYLHLLTDMMTSVAVLVSGVVVYFYQIYWVDSLITILIAFYLITASWKIFVETLRITMQFTPAHLDVDEVEQEILAFNEIEEVHHLHLWQLDSNTVNLEAHISFREDLRLSESSLLLEQINAVLKEKLQIAHTIFQPENGCRHAKDLLYSGEGLKPGTACSVY